MNAGRDEASTFVTHRWRAIMKESAAPADNASAALSELKAAYGAPGRHYHSLEHIAALLRMVDAEAARFADRTAVELAVFYHDAVYDAARNDNEAASARLAFARLPTLAVPRERTEHVVRLIEATAHGAASPDPADADMLRFLDLDLSILGAPRETYARYASAIRAEYAIYADPVYRAGRIRVLGTFLVRPRLYHCPDFHTLWDGPARDNLRWEISALESATA